MIKRKSKYWLLITIFIVVAIVFFIKEKNKKYIIDELFANIIFYS
mgnify:CR=1 FL=1